MDKENAIKLFEDKRVRVLWHDEQEKWFFSIIDVIEVLTGTDRPRKYWSDLKSKLISEGSQLSEKIGQLKMKAEDGKMRLTDVSKQKEPETFEENKTVARQGGQVANVARKQLEETTGKKVITRKNAKRLKEIKE